MKLNEEFGSAFFIWKLKFNQTLVNDFNRSQCMKAVFWLAMTISFTVT